MVQEVIMEKTEVLGVVGLTIKQTEEYPRKEIQGGMVQLILQVVLMVLNIFFAGRGSGGGGNVEIGDTDNTGAGGDGFHGIIGFSFIYNFGQNVGHYFGGEDRIYFGGGGGVLYLILSHM